MPPALKLDHLREVQKKGDHWAGKKSLGRSEKSWSRSVKDKQAKETGKVLLFLPPIKKEVLQRWRGELASMLKNLETSLSEVRIRQLVEQGNISQARRELSIIPMGASKQLDKWKRLLAEPVVKQGKPASGRGMHADLFWLENHSEQYRGKWVALKRGQLLGSDRSSVALEARLDKLGLLKGTTFFEIGE
jgi:hypothetical protein